MASNPFPSSLPPSLSRLNEEQLGVIKVKVFFVSGEIGFRRKVSPHFDLAPLVPGRF